MMTTPRGDLLKAWARLLAIAGATVFGGFTVFGQAIVAHRGASHDAPENTLSAFRLAWEQGADAIEGDFHLSKDGHIVCHHDLDLKRTANDWRKVADLTLAELQLLEVGSWKHARFKGESIPTVREVMAVVPEGKQLFLEIKCGPEIMDPLCEVLATNSGLPPSQLVFIAFDEEVIRHCRARLPEYKAHWLTSYKRTVLGTWKPKRKSILATLREVNASGLDTKADPDRVTPALVHAIRKADLEFHCWTVDTPALARHFKELGVDSITTNRPAWIREQLKREP